MGSKYIVKFSGVDIDTTVTDKAEAINEWVAEIMPSYIATGKTTVVGLDIEWRPHEDPMMSNKTATIQLRIDTKCLIIQLFYLENFPQSLKDFMGRPNFTFVGVEVNKDIDKLSDEYGLVCSNWSDIRDYAMGLWPMRWFHRPGLKALARAVVGLNMPKPIHVCKSDWQTRTLSAEQVEYACIDAYASYKIGKHLLMKA